jgi:serine/threonine protein kinase
MEFCEESLDQWFPSTKDENLGSYTLPSRPTKDGNLGYEQFMSQLTSGLQYIHEKGLVHGSIKPSNIFITSTKDLLQGPQIKLSSDFWITRENQMESLNSTPIWLAPELLESLMQHSSGQITVVQYTKASDIFAAGNAFFYYWSRGQNLFWKASGVTSGNTANLTSGVTSENMTNIMSGNQVNLPGKLLKQMLLYSNFVLHK